MFLNELYTEKAGMSVFLQAIAELMIKAEVTVYRGAPSQMCFPDPARPDEGIRTFAVQLMDNPELDDDLRMLLARCLAVDPNDRPSLADLLGRAQAAVRSRTAASYAGDATAQNSGPRRQRARPPVVPFAVAADPEAPVPTFAGFYDFAAGMGFSEVP